jgi:hypothetical protein
MKIITKLGPLSEERRAEKKIKSNFWKNINIFFPVKRAADLDGVWFDIDAENK